jgi:hypothetical protein
LTSSARVGVRGLEISNEAGGNDVGGDEVRSNEVGSNEVGGNEVGGNEVGGNEVGGNEGGGSEVGGNEIEANEVGGNKGRIFQSLAVGRWRLPLLSVRSGTKTKTAPMTRSHSQIGIVN